MAWHIFKKDLILLWPVALLCAFAQFALDGLMFASDHDPGAPYLLLTARLFVIAVFLVIGLAITLVVHQDAIPGTRQDWLIRPIRRRDLLLAKLLFVLVVVQLPMFLADLVEAVAQGLAPADAAGAALARNIHVLITLTLPILGIAALTRNAAQSIGVGIAYFIGVAGSTFLLSTMARLGGQEQATNPLVWTGVAWIEQAAAGLLLAAGAVTVLLLLYLRRRLVLAWSLFPLFAAASVLAVLLPWSWIFAVQEAVAAPPSQTPAVELAVDPQAPRYAPAPGESSDDYALGAGQVQLRGRSAGDIEVENKVRRAQGDADVYLPLRFQGLGGGAMPWADRALVTLRDGQDRILFQARGDDLKMDRAAPETRGYEVVRVPALVYETLKDRPLSLRIDYSMTVLQPQPATSAAALGADEALPGLGRCATRRDSDGDEVELRCLSAGRAPSCISAALQDPATGRRNPTTLICAPDYAPFGSRVFPDALDRFEVEAPFRDRLGVAAYLVGAAALDRARLILVRYEPSQHLTRAVAATGVRLSDWTAAAAR